MLLIIIQLIRMKIIFAITHCIMHIWYLNRGPHRWGDRQSSIGRWAVAYEHNWDRWYGGMPCGHREIDTHTPRRKNCICVCMCLSRTCIVPSVACNDRQLVNNRSWKLGGRFHWSMRVSVFKEYIEISRHWKINMIIITSNF